MEWQVELAQAGDDPAIRRLLSHTPMPGRVRVTFEREPDYFLGCPAMGSFCQVLVARRARDRQVVALACRAARRVFINGRPEEVGYLGQLRVDPRCRGRWLMSRGFRFLRQLHADHRVAGYLAAITEENSIARTLLVERPRPHFPTFREAGRLCTLSLILRKSRAAMSSSGYEVRRGTAEDLDAIVAFLNRHGAAKQFFPVYSREDFVTGAVPGFEAGDFLIAHCNGEMAGVLGLWDQAGFKQTVVQSYSGALRLGRPIYNLVARLYGASPLPAARERLRYAYASFICVARNDAEVFAALLQAAYRLAAQRGYLYLMVGLCEADPLLGVVRRYRHIAYHSRLYAICWDDAGDFYERLDGRVPYVEIAAL